MEKLAATFSVVKSETPHGFVAHASENRRAESSSPPSKPDDIGKSFTVDLSEFFRMPPPGKRCPRTGLSRGTYNDLLFSNPPKIKSVVIQQAGASRGIRLLHWPSVRNYLLTLMEEQTEKEVGDE